MERNDRSRNAIGTLNSPMVGHHVVVVRLALHGPRVECHGFWSCISVRLGRTTIVGGLV